MNLVNYDQHNRYSNHWSQCEDPSIRVKGHDKCEIVRSFWWFSRNEVNFIRTNRSYKLIFEVMSWVIKMFGHGYVYFSIVQLKNRCSSCVINISLLYIVYLIRYIIERSRKWYNDIWDKSKLFFKHLDQHDTWSIHSYFEAPTGSQWSEQGLLNT